MYVSSVSSVMITLSGGLRYGQIPLHFKRNCLASQIPLKCASRFESVFRAQQSGERILRALARKGCRVAEDPYRSTWRAHGIADYRMAQPAPSRISALWAPLICFTVQLDSGDLVSGQVETLNVYKSKPHIPNCPVLHNSHPISIWACVYRGTVKSDNA